MDDRPEGLAFRNPVKQAGFSLIYHVLTLDGKLSDGAYRLYALLLMYARDGECWPGRKRLARDLGKSVPTIERRLAELVKLGLITREQRLNQTAMTWIEDVETMYGVSTIPIKNDGDEAIKFDGDGAIKNDGDVPLKNDGDKPIKNDGDMSPSKMMGKEDPEEQPNNSDDDVSNQEKQAIDALLAFGERVENPVARPVAERLARRCSLEDVCAWIAYAEQATGLRDPVGLVVARLRDGEPAPALPKAKERDGPDSRRYIEGKYAAYIER